MLSLRHVSYNKIEKTLNQTHKNRHLFVLFPEQRQLKVLSNRNPISLSRNSKLCHYEMPNFWYNTTRKKHSDYFPKHSVDLVGPLG